MGVFTIITISTLFMFVDIYIIIKTSMSTCLRSSVVVARDCSVALITISRSGVRTASGTFHFFFLVFFRTYLLPVTFSDTIYFILLLLLLLLLYSIPRPTLFISVSRVYSIQVTLFFIFFISQRPSQPLLTSSTYIT